MVNAKLPVLLAYLKLHWLRFQHSLGIGVNGDFSLKHVLRFLVLLSIYLISLIIVGNITPVFRLKLIDILFSSWLQIIFINISAGILMGVNWLRFGDYKELIYLSGLPISRKEIATGKLMILTLELIIIMVIISSFLWPWGNLSPELFNSLLFFILLCLNAIYVGIFCALFTLSYLSKVVPYLAAVGILAVSFFLDIKPFGILSGGRVSLDMWGVLLFISIGLFFSSRDLLAVYFVKLLNQVRVEKGIKKESSGVKLKNMLMAIAYKDFLYFYRESLQLLQTLLVTILIILAFSRIEMGGELAILSAQVILFSIPFSIAGQISLNLLGGEGFLLQQIKMLSGTLRGYYLIEFLASLIYVVFPTILMYSLLNVLFLKELLSLKIVMILIFLAFIYSLLAIGMSTVFMEKRVHLDVPTRGTKVTGIVIYYLLGMGLPILLAFWNFKGDIGSIPIMFIIYGGLTFFCSLLVGVAGYLFIDKIVIE